MLRSVGVALVLLFCSLASVPGAQAEKRVALVIGNSAYQKASKLLNPGITVDALFEPLPQKPPARSGRSESILSDDPGQSFDLGDRLTLAVENDWPDDPNSILSSMVELCGSDLCVRDFVAREFFSEHIKRFSRSRRKAPIYWQLATPSASYSVWLYIHAFTKDTLFRVQNDYVTGKLAHEERQLEMLRAEAGPYPVAVQRKAIEGQEAFVDELRAFLDEVKRVAAFWACVKKLQNAEMRKTIPL